MDNNPAVGLQGCLHWPPLQTVACNLSGLREKGDVSERKGNRKRLLQRDEVRTQGEGTEDGTSPKDGCPDLKKNQQKTNTAQLHKLSEDGARYLLACESWAYFPPEQGLLCSCGWSLESPGVGKEGQEETVTESRLTAYSLPPHPTPPGPKQGPSVLADRKETLTASPSA